MTSRRFGALILSNGRPNRVTTAQTLVNRGYSGETWILVDDLDTSRTAYERRFPGRVLVFSKAEQARASDQGDNFGDWRSILYARNASFQAAKDVGLTHFVQLDDDYSAFEYRFDSAFNYVTNGASQLHSVQIASLDKVFSALCDFLDVSGASAVAMCQGGDFIGGKGSKNGMRPRLLRKAMNSFVCRADRPFRFIGRVNEDVNSYTRLASTGALFFSTTQVSLVQGTTQKNSGGLTEMYVESGTYVKSFYSVMYHPSSVHISAMGARHKRLHHRVSWRHTVPKILPETMKKPVVESES